MNDLVWYLGCCVTTLAVYVTVRHMRAKRSEAALPVEREFAVEPGHLQERLTLPQIEAREMIEDPLGAVPDLPFGHLNAAWKTFAEGVKADDELWAFTAPWRTPWGRSEVRTGYVALRGGTPASHFITLCREDENETAEGQASSPVGAATRRELTGLVGWIRKNIS